MFQDYLKEKRNALFADSLHTAKPLSQPEQSVDDFQAIESRFDSITYDKVCLNNFYRFFQSFRTSINRNNIMDSTLSYGLKVKSNFNG